MSDALLQALLGNQQGGASALKSAMYAPNESAWGIGANAIGSAVPLLNNPYASTTSNFGTTIGASLFAGLMAGLAKREAASDNARLFDLAGSAYGITDPAERSGIVQQEPRLAGFVAALNQQERDQAIETAQKKAEKLLNYDPAVIQGEADLAGGKKAAELAAENGPDPLQNPKSAQSQLQQQIRAEEDARRKEILGLNGASKLQATITALPALEVLAKDNTKTSDIPFIYQFVQAQDGGVVKEGEITMVQGASPLLKQYQAQLEGALNGKSTLTTGIKQQMVEEMKRMSGAQYENIKKLAEPFLAIGEQRGASRKNMMPFPEIIAPQESAPQQQQQNPQMLIDAQRLRAMGKSPQEIAAELRTFYGNAGQ